MQQFFKNAAEAWASSPHLRSKSNCTMKMQQKSKRKSEESQLPFKSKGCNEIQGFRGNCDSLGKLGMCPSLAEPDLGGFPRSNVSRETWHESNIEIGLQYTSRRRNKSFSVQQFFKNAAEAWASSPHLRSKSNCRMKLQQKSRREPQRIAIAFKIRRM